MADASGASGRLAVPSHGLFAAVVAGARPHLHVRPVHLHVDAVQARADSVARGEAEQVVVLALVEDGGHRRFWRVRVEHRASARHVRGLVQVRLTRLDGIRRRAAERAVHQRLEADRVHDVDGQIGQPGGQRHALTGLLERLRADTRAKGVRNV